MTNIEKTNYNEVIFFIYNFPYLKQDIKKIFLTILHNKVSGKKVDEKALENIVFIYEKLKNAEEKINKKVLEKKVELYKGFENDIKKINIGKLIQEKEKKESDGEKNLEDILKQLD